VEKMRESLEEFVKGDLEPDVADRLLARFHYVRIDLKNPDDYAALQDVIDHEARVMVNYFAVPPSIYGDICKGLAASGVLNDESRVVLEKPIGRDLKSSKVINDAVAEVFDETQVYRIDHYLGKETVLNLLALRFANSIFTTNWDHNTIDHVQITVAEEVGIEGRWGYFDQSGQLRDMVQNHLLQILTLVAMEPPVNLDGDSIRTEKIKVLKALCPITADNVEKCTVRGQYSAGFLKGGPVPGYLEEEGGNPRSSTETFVALRVDIDNWRWAGVPFYLRTGKRISHVFVADLPNYSKLLFITDAAINIAPGLPEKAAIVQNAVDLARQLGVEQPKVAALSAVEIVKPAIASTIDAACLSKMAERGQIRHAIVDGPLAFDNTISLDAAHIKQINSPVSGDVDILLAPDINAANILAKDLEYLAGATMAGIVIGAQIPIMLPSRSDPPIARLVAAAIVTLLHHSANGNKTK
jgi:hypothetical protein